MFSLAREYRRLGLTPRYFVDGRSRLSYKRAAARLLDEVFLIDTKGECVEQIMPDILNECTEKWIMRLDDDEAPSSKLVQWLDEVVLPCDISAVAFPRRALRIQGHEVQYARTIPGIQEHDYQYRCFDPSRVELDTRVHTPGIRFPESEVVHAPHDCCIYHFDWIIRSSEERKAKLARYESLQSGAGEIFKYQYAPEDSDAELYDFVVLEDPVISRLAHRLRAAKDVYETAKENALSRLRGEFSSAPLAARDEAPGSMLKAN
ncbi:MAG: hypothetical protein QOH65_1076 [Methylobacteriaceae bacterium]|nr:hypothetical protein [Methylobacteriaceae bacterium]